MKRKTNQRPSKSHTIAEIAARAGVSLPTVSRVLRLITEEPLDYPRVELTTTLVVRESCASLPSS